MGVVVRCACTKITEMNTKKIINVPYDKFSRDIEKGECGLHTVLGAA